MTAVADPPTATRTVPAATVTTTYGQLRDAVTPLAAGAPSRAAVRTMAGVLVSIEPGAVGLSTFDYETYVHTRIEGTGQGTQQVMVYHRELAKMLDALVTGMKRADARSQSMGLAIYPDGQLTVYTGESEVGIEMLPAEDAPARPSVLGEVTTVADTAEFTAAARRVSTAAGSDATLPFLTGINLFPDGNALRLECTDRFRATCAYVPAETMRPAVAVSMPATTTLTLLKHCASEQLALHLPTAENAQRKQIAVSTHSSSGVAITFAVADPAPQQAPNLHRLRPTDADTVAVTVTRAEAQQAIKRSKAVLKAKEEGVTVNAIQLEPSSDGNAVTFQPRVDTSCAVRSVSATLPTDAEVPQVAFNPTYLATALDHVPSETVTIHLVDNRRPAVITTAGDTPDGAASWHMVMPIRVD